MNNKIIALIMAVAMAAVGLAVGLGNMTQADEAGQSEADPVWIIGDADTAYLVKAGEEIKITDTVYPIIDFNLKAFDNPVVKISVAEAREIVDDDEEDLDYTWVPVGTPGTGQSDEYEGAVLANTSEIVAVDAADGVYNVKLKAASGENVPQDEDRYYYIKVDVTRNDPADDVKFAPETVSLYYAAHIMVTDEEYIYSVVLSTNVEKLENANTKIKTGGESDDTFQYLEFQQDVSFSGVYAMVEQVLSGDDQTPTYNNADYDFYAKDLPVGIAMKLDGEISGKLSASVSTTQKDEYGSFSVYAVDKATGDGLYLGDFKYKVTPAEGFTYEIGDTTYSWADPAYLVIKNTDDIEITISDAGVDVYITLLDDETGIKFIETTTADDKEVTIGDLDDYTGILQIQMEQAVADDDSSSIHTAIVHVLVLGPVVHSGLLPTATSS